MIAEEYAQTQATLHLLTSLPPLVLPDDSVKPMGHGMLQYTGLDYKTLIKMRRKHETKQAATGVRTRSQTSETNKTASLHGQIVQEFHCAIRAAQDELAIGTGVERQLRWRAAAPGGRDGVIDGQKAQNVASGNSANAAAAAATVASQVSA